MISVKTDPSYRSTDPDPDPSYRSSKNETAKKKENPLTQSTLANSPSYPANYPTVKITRVKAGTLRSKAGSLSELTLLGSKCKYIYCK